MLAAVLGTSTGTAASLLLRHRVSTLSPIGIALIGVDEFQGIAAASSANTRAAAAILEVASLGPPVFYIANYSLVYKFLGRAQQEQHRLLPRPVVVHVDPPGSDDWRATLEGFRSVAPGVLCFDPGAVEPERPLSAL